jgi:hypothetical protein
MTATAVSGCVYCSGPTKGHPRTCSGHTDLPRLDPFFTHLFTHQPQRKAEPIEDFRPEALLDRLQTTGR